MSEPKAEQDWMRLGAQIRERRKSLGLRQQDVAALGGPSTATLRQIENGRPAEYQIGTTWQLERVLGWRPGSINSILAGGDPWIAANPDYRQLVAGLVSPSAQYVSEFVARKAVQPAEIDFDAMTPDALDEVIKNAVMAKDRQQRRGTGGPVGGNS